MSRKHSLRANNSGKERGYDMETRVTVGYYPDTEDKIAEQNKKDRRTLVSAILLALFIIICMVGLILVFTLLEPHEYIDVFEDKHEVDIAGILREARECMKNLPHN